MRSTDAARSGNSEAQRERLFIAGKDLCSSVRSSSFFICSYSIAALVVPLMILTHFFSENAYNVTQDPYPTCSTV